MFLGLALMAVFILLGEFVDDALSRADWLHEDGWLHFFAAILTLLGAWKWLSVHEDGR